MANDTKERIRREALKLFSTHGVDAVSVKQVAAAVGMGASNLYVHYSSRDALVADLFTTGFEQYGRRLAQVAAGGGPFLQRLETMVRLICAMHDEDMALFRFLLLTQHHNLHGIDPRSMSNPTEVVQRVITEAMATGEIPARDPATVTAAIMGAVLQPAVFLMYGRLRRSMAEAADDIVAIILKIVA